MIAAFTLHTVCCVFHSTKFLIYTCMYSTCIYVHVYMYYIGKIFFIVCCIIKVCLEMSGLFRSAKQQYVRFCGKKCHTIIISGHTSACTHAATDLACAPCSGSILGTVARPVSSILPRSSAALEARSPPRPWGGRRACSAEEVYTNYYLVQNWNPELKVSHTCTFPKYYLYSYTSSKYFSE